MVSCLEPIFLVDHMVLPIRFSLLRKEDKPLLFTVSADVKNAKDRGEIDCFSSRNNDIVYLKQ
jgi:hypothetical protein